MLHVTDVQTVAALYCEGMPLSHIAALLALDIKEVQRLLEAAEQQGMLSYRPTLAQGLLDPDVHAFVYNETLTAALHQVLQDTLELRLVPLTIVPTPPALFTTFANNAESDTPAHTAYCEAEWASLPLVCRRAAQEVARCLFDGHDHTVGVNWGAIVRETIAQLHPVPSQLADAKLTVVSLFGDLGFHAPEHEWPLLRSTVVNGNSLVSQFVNRLGGCGEAVPLNVPGFIPARFARQPDVFAALRAYLTSHASYQRIFGVPPANGCHRQESGISNQRPQAKIAEMDTIITGFGAADQYTALHEYLTSWLDADEITTLLAYHRAGHVVGDIGGHLIPSLDAQQHDEVINFLTTINRRLLAAQPEDFVNVATRHLHTGKGAGVVGVTVGARKAKILYTLLSQVSCPISRLIMDAHCALALLALLDRRAFARFVSQEGRRLVERRTEWSASTRQLIPVDEG